MGSGVRRFLTGPRAEVAEICGVGVQTRPLGGVLT